MLCVGSVGLLVVALSTERWVTGRILCQTGVEIVNASHPELEQFIGDIYYGLFQGGKSKKCGLGKRRSKIYSKITHKPMALCLCSVSLDGPTLLFFVKFRNHCKMN